MDVVNVRHFVVSGLAAFALSIPLASLGGVTVQNYVEGQGPTGAVGIIDTATGATSAALTTSGYGSTAVGSADAVYGTLRSYAYAAFTPGVAFAAYSSVALTESIIFSGGFGQLAYFDYLLHGTITNAGNVAINNVATAGRLEIITDSNDGSAALSLNPANCGQGCISGTSINITGSVPIVISQGIFSLSASLYAYAQAGNTSDFGNTASFFLRTPDGVTFSSASGFLSAATPIFPISQPPTGSVPEPGTLALVVLALVGTTAVRRLSRPRH